MMSKPTVTSFTNRSGSPYQKKNQETAIVHKETLQKTQYETQKEKQNELLQKVNKKTAEYQQNKPSSGFFTEVTTCGAFTKNSGKESPTKSKESTPTREGTPTKNGANLKSLLGFPSSANDLALDAKSDLESDPNISKEVKDKVIEKLFTLVSMVQHVYESKVRIMTDFEKFKDTHLRNESRREKEHSEQLYKLNMNFQNEVVQAIQRLESELDISRNVTKNVDDIETNVNINNIINSNDTSVSFTSEVEEQSMDKSTSINDVITKEDGLNEVIENLVNDVTNSALTT